MKKGTPLFKNRKLRYGSLSVTLTAAIIAAVVIINVIFTHLASKHLWVIDMTSDGIYSLTEAGITYLDKTIESANDDRSEKGEDPVKVKILFCDEPDALEANELQRIVYVMAKELQNQFPDTIEVDWVDIIKNPSAVQSYGNPKTTSVIVISGTEYRTVPLTSFYVFDTIDSTEPWAYKVERTFAINIAGVTRAESPIACWTTNHGELPYDNEILSLITDAGYILQPIDLAKEDIPADCRLIVTYKPKNDFLSSKDGVSSISEVEKLDAFLGNANSYMIFTDADTPVLPNLEEYLEEWGISYARTTETDEIGQDKVFPYMIKAAQNKGEGKALLGACRSLVGALGSGAQDGGFAILLIASGSAFSMVLGATDGCAALMRWAVGLPLPTLVTFAVAIIVLTFLSGTPGCMIIAAPIFLPIAAQLGISNAVLMRIAVFGQCVLDTLPINGAILIVMSQARISMKEGYPGVFKTTVLYMFIGTVVVTALAMIAPGIW